MMMKKFGLFIAAFAFGTVQHVDAYAEILLSSFENCMDKNFSTKGYCKEEYNDRGLPSWISVHVNESESHLDFGSSVPCTNRKSICSSFTFYGWVKFHQYPGCNQHVTYVSSEMFNIQMQPDGRLKAFVWPKARDVEYQVVSDRAVLTEQWYVVMLTFTEDKILSLHVNKELYGRSNGITQRSFWHKNDHLMIGSDGHVDSINHIEVDNSYISNRPTNEPFCHQCWQTLTREDRLRHECKQLTGVMTGPFSCYFPTALNATHNQAGSENFCKFFGSYFGYAESGIANIKSLQAWAVIRNLISDIVRNHTRKGSVYEPWLNINVIWLNGLKKETAIKHDIHPMPNFVDGSKCTALATGGRQWSWKEIDCNTQLPCFCGMSYDCLANNPCNGDNELCRQTKHGATCENVVHLPTTKCT